LNISKKELLRHKSSCSQYIQGRFDGKKQKKKKDVERQVVAGHSNESWRYGTLLLPDSSPL
jgi:hypothetical protein